MRLGSPQGSFVLVEWQDTGETHRDFPIAPLHVHHDEDEAWYVLEGRLGFRLGDDEVEAGAGEGVLAAAGTPHSYWNAAGGPTRYLLVMGPRTAAMLDELHSPGAEDFPGIFARHGSELL
jgi:mannose-6-phosphate isomerase-like protein (cupin superfamily)